MQDKITCPYCSKEIPLTETLSKQIRESVRAEYASKAFAKEAELKKREEELKRRLGEIEKASEEAVMRKLTIERAKLVEEARKKAKDEIDVEMKSLMEERAEKDRQLDEARRNELEFRRKAREFDEKSKSVELEIERRVDGVKERIKKDTLDMFTEDHRLKDLEKEKKIADMQRMIEELKRKSEQGSQQAQGEVAELDLESILKSKFPVDVIEPVPKGVRGADIVQKVYTRGGQFSGSIVWEVKRTKAWNDDWIAKLKDDQREIKAEVAVIVSEAMPKGVNSFSEVDGVWVTNLSLAPGLAEALRAGLMQVALSRLSAVGKGEKMEAVYNYLSGPEFRQKVEAVVEAFKAMKEDLDGEKRAFARIWAKREKQIERVVTNTIKMYGDMQGIIGATLPEIKALELGSGAGDEDEAGEEVE